MGIRRWPADALQVGAGPALCRQSHSTEKDTFAAKGVLGDYRHMAHRSIARHQFVRALTIVSVCLALSACAPSDPAAQFQLSCKVQFHDLTRECLSRAFPKGSAAQALQQFLTAADFELAGSHRHGSARRDYSRRAFDYEKGPREILIMIEYQGARIARIDVAKWQGVWTRAHARSRSPFDECIRRKSACEEYLLP